ncbi:hypothetical protein [uncultured Tateyamaria sp.]|uniref:hypothetical protein n=1 Tax=uncultured Tateyamaria sp. TaxID=455651 RepID=UPI0026278CF2|nr:hypothetical protein [uncultured Tateyamaria sp.]
MADQTFAATDEQKALHGHISRSVLEVMRLRGKLLALCLLAEILGRLERLCEADGTPQDVIETSIEKNRVIGRASAQFDIDVAQGNTPASNARAI